MKRAKSVLLFLSGFGITGGVVALIVVAGSYGLSEFTSLDPLGTVLRAFHLEAQAQSTQGDDREILYWVAPMDANYRRDKPGKSHWLLNTFFKFRLTSIPVLAAAPTENVEPADPPAEPPAPPEEPDSLSSFVASKKGALIQFGW